MSTGSAYECSFCNYQTTYRDRFSRHLKSKKCMKNQADTQAKLEAKRAAAREAIQAKRAVNKTNETNQSNQSNQSNEQTYNIDIANQMNDVFGNIMENTVLFTQIIQKIRTGLKEQYERQCNGYVLGMLQSISSLKILHPIKIYDEEDKTKLNISLKIFPLKDNLTDEEVDIIQHHAEIVSKEYKGKFDDEEAMNEYRSKLREIIVEELDIYIFFAMDK